MENKGLCTTCKNDKSCIFQVGFPVLQCEEFSSPVCLQAKSRYLNQGNRECVEQLTEEE